MAKMEGLSYTTYLKLILTTWNKCSRTLILHNKTYRLLKPFLETKRVKCYYSLQRLELFINI